MHSCCAAGGQLSGNSYVPSRICWTAGPLHRYPMLSSSFPKQDGEECSSLNRPARVSAASASTSSCVVRMRSALFSGVGTARRLVRLPRAFPNAVRRRRYCFFSYYLLRILIMASFLVTSCCSCALSKQLLKCSMRCCGASDSMSFSFLRHDSSPRSASARVI